MRYSVSVNSFNTIDGQNVKNGTFSKQIFTVPIRDVLIWLLFVVSLINNVSLSIYLVIMMIWGVLSYCSKDEKQLLYILVVLQIRSVLSSGVATSISGTASLIKWVLLFEISIFLLLLPLKRKYKDLFNKLKLMFILLFLSCIITALFFSSYPFTATFKVISYIIPMIAITKGVLNTSESVKWSKVFSSHLGVLVFGSIVLVASGLGYLRNGRGFQGFVNHPNIYGVLVALFLASFLYNQRELSFKVVFTILASLTLAYLSQSRTAMLSCLILIVFFLFSKNIRGKSNTFLITLIVVFGLILVVVFGDYSEAIAKFIYKGNSSNLLSSRESLLTENMNRFFNSFLFGTGLNIPYQEGIRNFELSFDLIAENGNFYTAILGDIGLIGTVCFLLCYGCILKYGWGNRLILFIAPFAVVIGEQLFFSTNNLGIILYTFFGIYLAEGYNKKIERRII